MSTEDPKDTREGGREGAKRLTPELSGVAATPPRNSSGNASHAASLLDLRQYINLLCEIVLDLDKLNLIEPLKVEQLKRLRQAGFRGPRRG